eukprot:gnl/MRDRNA2_/MRDRNA2_98978_c0_seq1.p1 gnl/MRDRNA2_/MRDRNA2_98978_c0~~gnl/MRDRNA2_/MRDRNA2_98978_c0_seq1.p1  ORF type:complete len:253 (+),score=34.32 gnl/MRDRNA2_/MRDRNA2_98978_c0_seq1:108-866(+)
MNMAFIYLSSLMMLTGMSNAQTSRTGRFKDGNCSIYYRSECLGNSEWNTGDCYAVTSTSNDVGSKWIVSADVATNLVNSFRLRSKKGGAGCSGSTSCTRYLHYNADSASSVLMKKGLVISGVESRKQLWTLVAGGTAGSYKIRNNNSTKFLKVGGVCNSTYSPAMTYVDNSSDATVFAFTNVGSSSSLLEDEEEDGEEDSALDEDEDVAKMPVQEADIDNQKMLTMNEKQMRREAFDASHKTVQVESHGRIH